MENLTLREKFYNITGLTFDPQVLLNLAKTLSDEEKVKLLKKIIWLMPDGAFRDNNIDLIENNADFITDVINELEIENVTSYFKDTNGDGIVDIYDIINAPSTRQPVGPASNEIWYTTTDGEIYDFSGIIEMLVNMGGTYNGPAVVSNEFDEEKQMWRMKFNGDVTVLGDINLDAFTCEGPFFGTNTNYGITCNVETIILSKTVNKIGDYAFGDCSGLSSIEIPDSVTSIGRYAFYNCTSLASVIIPNSVTSIGDYAFESCNGLTSIICKATTPPTLREGAFDSTNDCPIYVSSQSVDAYKAAWSDYKSRIQGLLNNNQIRYNANTQLPINEGVDYTDHTFDNGVGIVTFNNDLTALDNNWFGDTFNNYSSISLTLPNGVSVIGTSALSGVGTVYYEGTQKECARINKGWFDTTGVSKYHCFDGVVDEDYISNIINPLILIMRASWFRELIGENLLPFIRIVGSYKINKHLITAGKFITTLVNGIDGKLGLSTYGFTVVNQEYQGVTIPLAYHTESNHFIGISKATNYAQLDFKHFSPVAVNESLNSDYMYILFDDTILEPEPEPTLVSVTIEHENGTTKVVSLDADQTYADQGYVGYYSQDTYDSTPGVDESAEDFLVDNTYPIDGATIYDYCNDIYEPEPEPDESPWEDIINDDSYVFDAGTITVGQTETVNIDGNVAKFSFTPENDGNYTIYSTGEEDTVGAIFDSNGNIILSNDDGNEEGEKNFILNIDLTSGETCYIHTTLYNYQSSGSFNLEVAYDGPDE